CLLSFHVLRAPRALHSFPTRRSSDLETIRLSGPVSTLLEWDDAIPAFDELMLEVKRIAQVRSQGLAEHCPVLTREVVESAQMQEDRKSTRLNSSHVKISYAVFCLKKK